MTHSGFKTAQRILNLAKKENNNKDYRTKRKSNHFSSGPISFNYVLRTKHGICLNEKNINFLTYQYPFMKQKNPHSIYFEEHSDEENKIIQEEINLYYNLGENEWGSFDKTHSSHSKEITKNRNKCRDHKFSFQQF